MTSSVTVDLLAIVLGLRAVIPLNFDPWERWPGGILIAFGVISLAIRALD